MAVFTAVKWAIRPQFRNNVKLNREVMCTVQFIQVLYMV